MSEIILILGSPSSGKTSSLKNVDSKKTVIITPNSKSLPFPGGDVMYISGKNRIVTNELDNIEGILRHVSSTMPEINLVVIDDFFHFISARIFSPSFMGRTKGNDAFQRWSDLGSSVFNSLYSFSSELRADLYVVVMAHSAIKEDGTIGIKTAGRLIDNTIEIPSYFSYIFHAMVKDKDQGIEYVFQTNKNSIYEAKTPMGAFSELYIDNDMQIIINRINEYRFSPQINN